jgi:hypothetical protein
MASTNRRSFLARSAAIAVVPTVATLAGVLNGIGGVDGRDSLRGTQLSGLIVFLSQFLPDIHRG